MNRKNNYWQLPIEFPHARRFVEWLSARYILVGISSYPNVRIDGEHLDADQIKELAALYAHFYRQMECADVETAGRFCQPAELELSNHG